VAATYIAMRVIAAVAGTVCLYLAFFLHEEEEGRLSNRLAEIWIRVDDLQKRSKSKVAAFLSIMSQTALSLLDRMFGERSLSLRALRACVIFSFASTFLCLGGISFFATLLELAPSFVGAVGILLAIIGLMFFAVGLVSTLVRNRAVSVLSYIVAAILVGATFAYLLSIGFGVAEVVLIIVCSVTIDLLFLRFLRWLLRAVIVSEHAIFIVAGLAISLIAALFINPMYVSLYLNNLHRANMGNLSGPIEIRPFPQQTGLAALHHSSWNARSIDMAIIFSTNTLDAACALLIFVVMAVALLHLLVWPLLQRPLYAAQRRSIFTNTKALTAAGITFLGFALLNSYGGVMDTIRAFVR
jgi:hypothetical protein